MCFKTQVTLPRYELRKLMGDLTPQGRRNLYGYEANDAAFTAAFVTLYGRIPRRAQLMLVKRLHESLQGEE